MTARFPVARKRGFGESAPKNNCRAESSSSRRPRPRWRCSAATLIATTASRDSTWCKSYRTWASALPEHHAASRRRSRPGAQAFVEPMAMLVPIDRLRRKRHRPRLRFVRPVEQNRASLCVTWEAGSWRRGWPDNRRSAQAIDKLLTALAICRRGQISRVAIQSHRPAMRRNLVPQPRFAAAPARARPAATGTWFSAATIIKAGTPSIASSQHVEPAAVTAKSLHFNSSAMFCGSMISSQAIRVHRAAGVRPRSPDGRPDNQPGFQIRAIDQSQCGEKTRRKIGRVCSAEGG